MAARSTKKPKLLAAATRSRLAGGKDKDEAFRAIRALVGALQTSARAVEARTGLTNAQLFLLRQIAGSDGLTVNELSQRTSAAQSSVSVVVGRLVRAGHVRRSKVAGDGRRVALTATARGKAVIRRAPAPATERLLRALGTLPARDARSISHGLGALLGEMNVALATAPLLFGTKAD